jgi:hypothetical protein
VTTLNMISATSSKKLGFARGSGNLKHHAANFFAEVYFGQSSAQPAFTS